MPDPLGAELRAGRAALGWDAEGAGDLRRVELGGLTELRGFEAAGRAWFEF